jgi:hypothetical protein
MEADSLALGDTDALALSEAEGLIDALSLALGDTDALALSDALSEADSLALSTEYCTASETKSTYTLELFPVAVKPSATPKLEFFTHVGVSSFPHKLLVEPFVTVPDVTVPSASGVSLRFVPTGAPLVSSSIARERELAPTE